MGNAEYFFYGNSGIVKFMLLLHDKFLIKIILQETKAISNIMLNFAKY